MFKGFLKKYSFVLCASLCSTSCLAMEWDIDFDECYAQTYQADKYMDFDDLRCRLLENDENARKLLFEILDESRESLIHYDKKFMSLYAHTEELSEIDHSLLILYQETLLMIAKRYSELILDNINISEIEDYLNQAIFYYMMGAKAKCPLSYQNCIFR